ncbi:UDP-N-acetylglucosamine 1-carboxyvinyltransferase [Lachnotalea glycerini]|uniref:UDP-N-acetylglucosamine 1-carboxyvinyltransferase n=1 Tax=Lachnotalea glycerini TaxID=1763509 RepID=A0A255IQQ6_9FIRM|nr:UDP-N-acetylglucosamine 1-carboxyvinyltransferase [Lachnotalea glycerini]PXV89523.1 UDP-N-acetylglucosamine 1-carboxyvinyltransferase [Lachnotalea glycerini]RDY32296.1 UDP-N-acetylglucosamine 1-carboxyvinyltransferase [Lachnotalea glycerini]
MNSINISGGLPLNGEVAVQGSKNAALPIIAAAILCKDITILHNCPHIVDVDNMTAILQIIGCKVVWEDNSLIIDSTYVNSYEIPLELADKMRSSVLMSGALLGRLKKAVIPYPGGCVIGKRPINIHLEAFKQMNIGIYESAEGLIANTSQIKGNIINLPISSVGATENIILAGVCATGTTIIKNAAKEPEVMELCRFLNKMGGDVRGAGTGTITINGVMKLHGAQINIASDRIAAGTYILAAMGTRGKIILNNAPMNHLTALLEVVNKMGGRYMCIDNQLIIDGTKAVQAVKNVETSVYPGFPTDLQSQLLSVLTVADGESMIKENIFEARFKTVEWLLKMGADIVLAGNKAKVTGVKGLHGEQVKAEELRGGAALIIAGLIAEGNTNISEAHYIERGYQDICKDLEMLGADISYD